MKILLAAAHGADPSYGGAERYFRDLGHGLERRGHEVAVLSAHPPGADSGLRTLVLHSSDWRASGSRRLRNHAGEALSPRWPRIRRLLAAERPELLHTGTLSGMGSGIWALGGERGAAVVHTLHDYHLLCPRTTMVRPDGEPCRPNPLLCGARTRSLGRWAGSVGLVIAGSRHLLDAHSRVFGRDTPARLIRLPRASLARPLDPPAERPAALGYIGALTEQKGVGVLLEAVPELTRLGVRVRIAGDGPLRERVAAAEVDYAGRVDGEDAKAGFLEACDLGVVPSLWAEPSGPPYVVTEWVAAGRPVLVSGRGGLAEVARSDGTLPFEPTPAGLLEALARLCDPAEWRAARARVPATAGDADVERWLDEHLEAYEGAMASAGVRAR